ncbi:hypothetical protein O3M35_003263 [Rhynocoris fuscipes]|uniref:Uncharacterized protein n=1 Tax=Rhynocoris fuscipes TaxID=488301 RepID=A0AAW1CR00_9HEMI
MLERNSWISMNRRTVNRSVLGIRREDGDEISKSVPTSRIFLVITILTGIGFLISLSAFSIYSSRNNTSRILSITKNKNNNLNDFNKNMTIKTESIDTILNRTTIEEVSREIIEQEQSRLDNREDNEERFIEEDTSASSKSLDISSRHSRAYPEQQHPSTTTTGLNSQINSRGIMNKKLNNNNNNNIDDQSGANPSVTQYGEQYAQLEQYYHYPSSVSSSSREKGIKRKELDDNIKGRIEHMVMSSGPAIKFTGVYVRGPFEHLDPQIYSNQYMNSNQYGSDPFVKYKPQHPSEINHLAASSTTYDIDTGPR